MFEGVSQQTKLFYWDLGSYMVERNGFHQHLSVLDTW